MVFEGNLFSVAFRIGIASATAYALGMTIDVFAFQAIREKYSSWWIAPSLSTVISNVIDSYVFFLLLSTAQKTSICQTIGLKLQLPKRLLKLLLV